MNRSALAIAEAAERLRAGAVLAYPTEAVWGLGCDPRDAAAVRRLLAAKRRDEAQGLILIAASLDQLEQFIDWSDLPADRRDAVLASWPGPNTWLMPCQPAAPGWLRGAHATLAVRVTAHPIAAALCEAFGGALVSTSANRSGSPAPHAWTDLDPELIAELDGVVAGETGGDLRPSTIRDARTGTVLRG